MKAYLQRYEPLLFGLKPKSAGPNATSSNTFEDWMMRSARAKGSIILCLGEAVASQTRLFMDGDEKTASDLWKVVERIFTMSKAQMVQNIKQRLGILIFKENGNWDKHVASFLTTVVELPTYDAELSESEKTSKLIPSLPSSFAPLAMVSSLQDLNIEKFVNAVQAEVAWRCGPHNVQQPNDNNTYQLKAHFAQRSSHDSGGRDRRRGRRGKRVGQRETFGGRVDRRTCNYCKHLGHFYNDCWDRLRDGGQEAGKRLKNVPHRVPIEMATSARKLRTLVLLVVISATIPTPYSQLGDW